MKAGTISEFTSIQTKQFVQRLALVALISAWLSPIGRAQLQTGSISGQITDPQGAAIPNATVELIDQERNIERKAATNNIGFYIFPQVPTGVYTVSSQVSGFQRVEQKDILLHVNQNLNVSLTLQLATTAQTAVVTAAVSQVDTEKSTVQETVDARQVTEMVLNGRNVLQLQGLVNGMVYTGAADQQANTPGYQANGATYFQSNYTLDGGENEDSFFNSAIPYPNPDALQEFTVQTSNYDAEYGRNRGATVNAVMKSGTNEFHGTVYEFVRNTVFDARNFFANQVAPFKRNQFGATVGGPVRKDKLFFFFAWESDRDRGSPTPLTFTSPDAAMRAGNFSEIPKAVLDPLTGTAFPGNIIPQSRLSQPALKFLSEFVPLPNLPNSLWSGPSLGTSNWDSYMGRADYHISSNDQFFAHYIWSLNTSLVNRGSTQTMFQNQRFPRQSFTMNETHTFSPTLLNSVTGTFDRVNTHIDDLPTFNWEDLGAAIPPTIPNQEGWVNVAVSGYFTATNGVPWRVIRNMYAVNDTLTWVKGRHTMKFGAQISRYQTHQLYEYLSAGSASFTGQFTGNAAADLMVGQMASFQQASPGLNDLRQTLWGYFSQDDVKVTARFTLNLGLRWEPYLGFRELHGEVASFEPGKQSQRFPTALPGLLYQGDPGVNPDVFKHDWNNFAPRVGFAWDVFGDHKTAVRGAYGIFYDSVAGIRLNRFPLLQPFLLNITVFGRPLADPYLGAPPFPYTPPSTPQQAQSVQFVTGAGATSANTGNVTPYAEQWNLTVERQLARGFLVSVGYVGNLAEHLFISTNLNPAIYGPGATVGNTAQRRIYPLYGAIESEQTTGYSKYHSLQVLVKRSLARYFTLSSAYTFSKNTGYTGSQSEGSVGTRDPLNFALDNGILPNDVTHVWATSAVWNLPELKQSRLLEYTLGGWELSGILQVQSGFPFTVRSGVDNSFSGQALDTADLVGTPSLTSGSRGAKVQKWFNTSAFALNAPGTFGDLGINTMWGPGRWTLDMGLLKNFLLGEAGRRSFQFRAEFFNVTNNVNLGQPTASVISASFGRITATSTDPRVLQLGLKFIF
ncbi:MAG TPA: carboxypeptidase regulatory-like domain-containing protein [Bryobacteraceae bacterium]|nr:carboxypeptidase regulatory-like domain-containing protein [Bryobacteraceae bacterium]